MSSNKGNFAVLLAALALAVSVYGVFTDNEVIVTQTGETISSNNDEYNRQWVENNSNDSLSAEILELRRYILDLEERLNNQQFNDVEAPQGMPVQADFQDAVLEVIALKEEQDRQKLKEKNPMYGFYEDLPEDYEIRIKTDPDYARQVGKDLKAQIVDENLSATERLAAMSQLQMTMFMLNKTEMPEYDYEAVDAILSIGRNSSDDKVKIQALEVVAHTPVADARVSDSFMSLLEKEDNDYIRSMAAEGLVAQYYKSQSKQPELSKKVAQDILSLYDNASDAKLKQLFDNIIGDARMLDELRNAAGQ
ncbi:hypothetical protein PCIT_b1256 [Pseudoalteromonas citrea]|uniref:HEAT repeat domain-containing protein n=2 Tax=Pseudoalteromonas citrea TaxID=43655 RepID=A0AAD4FQJ4_9GAMM|nr:hypothetical protein [Pseudoalteromonas citrea]KAF7765108.1 hypothetical protein PCIT_b1256 [Pseudoalteromonas citrea]